MRIRTVGTAIWALVAAVGVLVLALVHPALALAPFVILALPLMFRLRLLAGLTALAMLFSGSLASISQTPIVGYVDEALIVVLLLASVTRRLSLGTGLRKLPGTVPLLIFLLLGSLSSLANAVPFGFAASSAFIIMKGWLFAYSVAQIEWNREALARAVRFGGWTIAVTIATFAANFILGSAWIALWNGAATYTTRFGLLALQGLFSNPLVAGNTMACAFLLVLTHALAFGATRRHWALMIGSAAGVGLTGRRTATVGAAAGGILAGLRLRAATTVVQVVLLAPIAIALAWSTITEALGSALFDYVERGETAARSIMHRDMFDVASSHFPWGAGFGRFGSYMAGQEYSPEYYARGYQYVWGLSEARGNATFLTDTQWPAVVGETGYFGAAGAILAIIMTVALGWRSSRSADLSERWLGSAVVSMTAVLLFASIGVPVFFGGSPLQAPYFATVGVLVAYRALQRQESTRAFAPRRRLTRF